MILVLDYGAGNIGSVLNMIKKAGGQAMASANINDIQNASKLLLPGVGSFDNAMDKLEKLGLVQPIRDKAEEGIPMLGICLGMQLLSSGSEEGLKSGLGLIPGKVKRFKFDAQDSLLRVPHMGWNRVVASKQHALMNQLENDARFYFVHSYHYECEDTNDELFRTHYGYDFTSGVQRGNVMGVQFHPEKSHRYGMQLFKNFIGM
ncbi:imidazole glycerol phosphate synthase subunit HisH [Methylotenera mobilis]|uniref:imidazole glycerol phosphate synthase subunit HisH n=1 Tax=Methylotenera mobilis TaxID=359408 RepID=UPI0003825981|nr:imidazole glycerol phosphate synthase subunit HisH [Methylotenera mobilis]